MQEGLLDTYQRPISSRRAVAWTCSALLLAAYVLLYFGGNRDFGIEADPFSRVSEQLARTLSLPKPFGSKWTLYGALYTLAMVMGGLHFLRRHGNSPYQRVRTIVVVFVQVVLAFALPLWLQVVGRQEYYFSYFWPLKMEYMYPSYILHQPFLVILYSALGSLIALPLLAFFLGKRFYCSWICGCGGLANTAGDSFRHLSSKTAKSWRLEQVTIHTMLALAVATTAIVSLNWAVGRNHPSFAAFAFGVQRIWGAAVGGVMSGVIGVGLYPLMGTRVWCRFACPMAALLGLAQKLGRFRISVKKDMCIACGNCSTYCEMGIDVRQYAMANADVRRASCVGCGMCAHVCPRGVLRLETRADRFKGGIPIRVFAVDL